MRKVVLGMLVWCLCVTVVVLAGCTEEGCIQSLLEFENSDASSLQELAMVEEGDSSDISDEGFWSSKEVAFEKNAEGAREGISAMQASSSSDLESANVTQPDGLCIPQTSELDSTATKELGIDEALKVSGVISSIVEEEESFDLNDDISTTKVVNKGSTGSSRSVAREVDYDGSEGIEVAPGMARGDFTPIASDVDDFEVIEAFDFDAIENDSINSVKDDTLDSDAMNVPGIAGSEVTVVKMGTKNNWTWGEDGQNKQWRDEMLAPEVPDLEMPGIADSDDIEDDGWGGDVEAQEEVETKSAEAATEVLEETGSESLADQAEQEKQVNVIEEQAQEEDAGAMDAAQDMQSVENAELGGVVSEPANAIPSITGTDALVQHEKIRREALNAEARNSYEQGINLFDAGEYEKALTKFEKAVSINPALEEARTYVRRTRQLLGRPSANGADVVDTIADMRKARLQAREMEINSGLENADTYLLKALNPSKNSSLTKTEQVQASLNDLESALGMLRNAETLLDGSGLTKASEKTLKLRILALKGQIAEAKGDFVSELAILDRQKAQQDAQKTRINSDALRNQETEQMFAGVQRYFDRGEYEKALTIVTKMQALDKNNPKIREWILKIRRADHQDIALHSPGRLKRSEDVWAVDVEEAYIMPREMLIYPYDWERVRQRAKLQTSSGEINIEKRRIYNVLDEIKGNFDYREQELDLVLNDLRRRSKLNIMLDKDVDAAAPVELTLTGVSMRTALDIILRNSEPALAFRIKDQAVEVFVAGTEGSAEKILKLYPVADIITPMTDFKAPSGSGDDAWGDDDDDDDDDDAWEVPPVDLPAQVRKFVAANWGDDDLQIWEDNLLVMQTPEVQARVTSYLDKMRAVASQQVLVEGRFMTVDDDFMETIGFDWFGTKRNTSHDNKRQTMIGVQYNPLNRNDPQFDYGGVPGNTRAGGFNTAFNYMWSQNPVNYLLNSLHTNFAMHAAQRNEKGSVMHNPKVLVANAHTAYCQVVVDTPYIKSYTVSSSNVVPVVDNYRQGVTWQARPVISFDRKYITVKVKPRMEEHSESSYRSANVGFTVQAGLSAHTKRWAIRMEQPVTRETLFETNATVPDGGTILVGGQLRDKSNESNSGVPVLSSLPYAGRLFRTEMTNREGNNRVIMVSAKIVNLEE